MATVDPRREDALLRDGGSARRLPGGAAFGSPPGGRLHRFGRDLLASAFDGAEDGPTWAMPPQTAEIVPAGEPGWRCGCARDARSQRAADGALAAVPRGIWHAARVLRPARLAPVAPTACIPQRDVAR